ncbi:hypothetical protein L210DRAFT_3514359 [Boletus edulis BED1]|uniref:Uncharacterized protein n=1 Tax=Boletus edulis BED1 TaxID=1328754 RepID=A0AAD4C959_BOLED|nr:hypothetical protein L210DRAFT_3514359 [Boletus edulis BED1]
MVFLINNNVASVEDVAHSSLSPAVRVAQRCTPGFSPASSPSQVVQCSSNLADSPASLPSQAPSAASSTGHFSFHFDQYEEWTNEVEARMQNELDRMLEDARRVLTEPVPNISELFPDDLLADSVAHQTAADSLASRFAPPRNRWPTSSSLKRRSDNGSQTKSTSRRSAPASHRFHQRLLTSTYDRGGGDGSLLTPPLWRCDSHMSIHPIEKPKKI